MSISVNLGCSFNAVFLVNGKLIEGGEIIYGRNEVVYVTVLPLGGMLLSYSVKLVGAHVAIGDELAKCYALSDNRYFVKLAPRYSYVYSALPDLSEHGSGAERLFFLIKANRLSEARKLLTVELNSSIDDQALSSFFDGFEDIIPYNTTQISKEFSADSHGGRHLLVDKNGGTAAYDFVCIGAQIDNIIEL